MDIRLPNLGEGADSGTVLEILVSEGDQITADQAILELESEKAIASVPAGESGVVQKIHVQSGQVVSAGTLLISLSTDQSSPAPAAASSAKAAPSTADAAAPSSPSAIPAPAAPAADTTGILLETIPDPIPMPVAPPSVRFIAAQLEIGRAHV